MLSRTLVVLKTNILVSAVLSKASKVRQALDKAQNIGNILIIDCVNILRLQILYSIISKILR
jgi:hypothetical protein